MSFWFLEHLLVRTVSKPDLHEFHILEPRNEEINVKKIFAVKDATCAVAKKVRLLGIRTLTSAIPVQRSTNWASKPTGSRSLKWFVI